MATKVINGTHTNTVALGTYPTYSDFSLTGVITVAANVGVFGNATKAWTVANSGLVSGTNGLAFSSGGLASTVSNTGTIVGTGTSGIGVLLQSGGSVQNHGLIQGTLQGFRASGGLGIVSNFGTVLSSDGAALALTSGGTVANFGTIASSASYGISLTAGFISNGSTAVTTALVSGYRFGIVANPSTTATGVVNYGTIVATATNGKGVLLQSGGNVINGGLISGTVDAVRVSGGSSTVNNAGTVAGTTGGGIVLNANGTVFNTGTVTTAQSYAVYVKDGATATGPYRRRRPRSSATASGS
jgi:fibronectin-binding autotransporter adhesin